MNLVWHRADLRTHDHPALYQAAQGGPLVGLVNLDPHILEPTTPRRRAWFYANTQALREAYARRGGTLLVRYGTPWEVLPRVVAELGVQRVFAIASYTPYGLHRDHKTEQALPGRIHWCEGNHVQPPGRLLKPDGTPYTVYTPYAKRWWGEAERLGEGPLPPGRFPALERPELELGQVPQEPSDAPLPPPGEEAALQALEAFLRERLPTYHQTRDRLDGQGARGSPPTSPSASYRPGWRCIGPCTSAGRGPVNGLPNWPGATSARTCSTTARRCSTRALTPAGTGFPGWMTLSFLRLGKRERPELPWWTRRCANSTPPVLCLTEPAWR